MRVKWQQLGVVVLICYLAIDNFLCIVCRHDLTRSGCLLWFDLMMMDATLSIIHPCTLVWLAVLPARVVNAVQSG